MFYVVLNSRTNMYYNSSLKKWVSHLVCATFFDYQTQADEIVDRSNANNGRLITLVEYKDLSTHKVDEAVERLSKL